MPSFNDLRDRLRNAVFTGTSGQRYQIRELLGEGGQGWVFKAAQQEAAAPFVVIKVLRPDLVASDSFTRFEREAAVLRALSSGPSPHPHIVRFFEHGRAPVQTAVGALVEVPYLVLEFVDGPPLSRVLAAHGGFGLPVARVRRILRQVARALVDLHAQNIVHRDLKPSNILLTQREASETAKVTDFGLVKVVDSGVNHTVTVAGASAGYAPPEQYEVGNRRVSQRTDVFAFGAILFEALSGCEAFPVAQGETALRLVARMLGGERPALTRLSATIPRELRDRPELTAALDREIARATDGDPAKRHASIEELWGAVEPLLRAVSGGSGNIGRTAEPPPSSSPLSPAVPAARKSTPSVAPLIPQPAPSVSRSSAPDPIAGRASAPSQPAAAGPTARLIGKPLNGEKLRCGSFSEGGRSLVAVGAYGLYQFASGVWSAMRAPRNIEGASVRGVLHVPGGDLLLYGDGFAMRMSPQGQWSALDFGGGEAVWLGAAADDSGVVLVGERRSRPLGVAAILPAGGAPSLRDVEGSARLHGAARLAGGMVLVCGTHGALFVLDGNEVQEVVWGRTGHLYAATAASDGGAYVVGSGGHALSIAPPHPSLRGVSPPATLEAVQTTRDLTAVIRGPSGAALAAGAQGRLLRREGGTWSRVPLDATSERLIAIAVAGRSSPADSGRDVVALAEDGAVIEVGLA